MRPSFLLDANISPVVAAILVKEGLDARAIAATPLTTAEDEDLLRLAVAEGRVFVTYDKATIPASVAALLREGLEVPAVVYVHSARIPSDDFSLLARSLKRLAARIDAGELSPSTGFFLERA